MIWGYHYFRKHPYFFGGDKNDSNFFPWMILNTTSVTLGRSSWQSNQPWAPWNRLSKDRFGTERDVSEIRTPPQPCGNNWNDVYIIYIYIIISYYIILYYIILYYIILYYIILYYIYTNITSWWGTIQFCICPHFPVCRWGTPESAKRTWCHQFSGSGESGGPWKLWKVGFVGWVFP